MEIRQTSIQDLVIIEPRIFRDDRGFFTETFNAKRYLEATADARFVQHNLSKSAKNVLRGIHFQERHPQSKLVRVAHGTAWDVAVDLRKDSPTFGKWEAVELSGDNQRQFFIPEGFGHGFCTLTDDVVFEYLCGEYYVADDQCGVLWNDPDLAVDWPVQGPSLSDKDLALPSFAEWRVSQSAA